MLLTNLMISERISKFTQPTMHILIITFLTAISFVASAEEDLRSGAPKDCYLYSWGKGPNWTVKVSLEFRLSLLNLTMPYVDDQYSEPTEKALTWIERQKEPTITTETPPKLIGRKAMARVISDFAAMAGTPCHALVTLIAPPQTPVKRVLAVYAGSGSDAIYRVSNILRFQSPDPNVYLKKIDVRSQLSLTIDAGEVS
jgi:hypothetical protein